MGSPVRPAFAQALRHCKALESRDPRRSILRTVRRGNQIESTSSLHRIYKQVFRSFDPRLPADLTYDHSRPRHLKRKMGSNSFRLRETPILFRDFGHHIDCSAAELQRGHEFNDFKCRSGHRVEGPLISARAAPRCGHLTEKVCITEAMPIWSSCLKTFGWRRPYSERFRSCSCKNFSFPVVFCESWDFLSRVELYASHHGNSPAISSRSNCPFDRIAGCRLAHCGGCCQFLVAMNFGGRQRFRTEHLMLFLWCCSYVDGAS